MLFQKSDSKSFLNSFKKLKNNLISQHLTTKDRKFSVNSALKKPTVKRSTEKKAYIPIKVPSTFRLTLTMFFLFGA